MSRIVFSEWFVYRAVSPGGWFSSTRIRPLTTVSWTPVSRRPPASRVTAFSQVLGSPLREHKARTCCFPLSGKWHLNASEQVMKEMAHDGLKTRFYQNICSSVLFLASPRKPQNPDLRIIIDVPIPNYT